MTKKTVFACPLLIFALILPAWAGFPFSFRKPTIKTDYSQTVWDQIMLEQSASDIVRGMNDMRQAHYQEASNNFAKAVIKNTKDPMGYLLLGASLYWAGKVEEAISEYKEALRLDPHNALANQLLGIAAGWKGDISSAQAYFLTANQLDPNKADTNMNLGSTYAVQNQLEQALDYFRRASELAPREPLYHYQLGTLYEMLGRDTQAEMSFKKALHYFPAYEDAQLSLGALYENLNRPQEALKFYKKAVKTKPGDYVARLRYALLLVKLGDEKTARTILEEAFSISKFNQDGLALNAVYLASGTSVKAFENQIEKFAQNLYKVSASKPIQIEVGLEYLPPPENTFPEERIASSFEREYQKIYGVGEDLQPLTATATTLPRSFKRMFTLPAESANKREEQVKNFIQAVRQVVSETSNGQTINLSLQGRTADYASPSALTQNKSAPPKAVYDPHIVGNDMGLWVMGRTWLKFVREAEENLQEMPCTSSNVFALLTGLSALAVGNPANAQISFEQATTINPQDALAQLGLGTTAIMARDDLQAQEFYNRALKIDPNNKTAKRNLKILSEE